MLLLEILSVLLAHAELDNKLWKEFPQEFFLPAKTRKSIEEYWFKRSLTRENVSHVCFSSSYIEAIWSSYISQNEFFATFFKLGTKCFIFRSQTLYLRFKNLNSLRFKNTFIEFTQLRWIEMQK